MILQDRPPCAKNRDGTWWNQQTCCGYERRNSWTSVTNIAIQGCRGKKKKAIQELLLNDPSTARNARMVKDTVSANSRRDLFMQRLRRGRGNMQKHLYHMYVNMPCPSAVKQKAPLVSLNWTRTEFKNETFNTCFLKPPTSQIQRNIQVTRNLPFQTWQKDLPTIHSKHSWGPLLPLDLKFRA